MVEVYNTYEMSVLAEMVLSYVPVYQKGYFSKCVCLVLEFSITGFGRVISSLTLFRLGLVKYELKSVMYEYSMVQ